MKLQKKNAQLKKRLEQERKDRELLEMNLSKKQEDQGAAAIELLRHLGKHVKDMHTWKDFLEFDKDYLSIDLHVSMAEDLASQAYPQRIESIDSSFNDEAALLEKLMKERSSRMGSDISQKSKK